MPTEEIQSVCFVGAGNMGCFNATKAAISGYRVTLYDVSEDNLQQFSSRFEGFAAFLVGNGYCTAQDIPVALSRITPVADLGEAVAGADLVSESVFERLDIKRQVHRQLDELCPDKTLLTTNSSYLLLSDIEDVVQRGDRIAAMHSYMGSPLMDIVGGPRTSRATIRALKNYVESINAIPLVLKKEHRGYVLNAILGPILGTAMKLVSEGLGSIEEVDRAWMRHRCAPMGPLGILDLIGLNLVYDSWEHRPDEGLIPGLRPLVLSLLQPFVPGFVDEGDEMDALYQPLLMALVASAVLVAAAGVAETGDIDRAWTVGTSLDKGPFTILGDMGNTAFLVAFEQHVASGWFDPELAKIVNNYFAEAKDPG
jgi:3-hydroxybutyryl-CoA dehydrogenase